MRKALSIIVAAACVAVAVPCGFRIEQVNAAYPEQHAYAYSMGEEATYAGQNSSGGDVGSGLVTVKALDFRSIGYEGLKKMVLGYEDSLIEEGTFGDMRALFVEVKIENASSNTQKVHVRDYHLESGAWHNGLYAPLYMSINEDPSTMVDLAPGEKAERTLVYLIYDTQMNNQADWSKVEQRDYSLELALYPDKYLIDLGIPVAGGAEGGVA
ncbi:hypothetical protein [Gordonibacter sp.]|uniref:hypothetical protein n=1 Tax=Gordonibacter sp. TaxID=1968902 RepID=UPI002FCBCADF